MSVWLKAFFVAARTRAPAPRGEMYRPPSPTTVNHAPADVTRGSRRPKPGRGTLVSSAVNHRTAFIGWLSIIQTNNRSKSGERALSPFLDGRKWRSNVGKASFLRRWIYATATAANETTGATAEGRLIMREPARVSTISPPVNALPCLAAISRGGSNFSDDAGIMGRTQREGEDRFESE